MVTGASGASSGSPLVVNGLVSGINTQAVIQALLQSYQIPINNLQSQQSNLNTEAGYYQAINTDAQALTNAANGLNTQSSWNLATATTSDSAVATAAASPGAATGSLTFDVTQLAQANLLVSGGSVASTGAVVTSSPTLLVATGGAALGFSSLSAGSGLATGSHSIQVTQSSAAATVTGSSALGATTTISTSNDVLNLTVNGTAYSLTIPSGTYSPGALATEITQLAGSAGAAVTASVGSSGALQLSTTEQDASATLSVGAGSTAPGLTSTQSAVGRSAVVSVDGQSHTLGAVTPGAQVALNSSGTIMATIASSPGASGSLVSVGSAKADLVSTGNGSLASVVSAINGSGLGVSANAVQQANGSYLLQVGATSTGLAGAVSLDPAALAGGALGSMNTVTQAQDAMATVGGKGGYQVSSSTDTFTGLLSGTAITAASTGQATVSVSPDAAGEASKVQSLVNAANKVLSDIQTYAGYDATTKKGGPLMGSAVLNSLQQEILSTFASVAGTSGLGNALAAGISLTKNGTIKFDSTAFQAAYSADPSKVASLFTQGGSFTPSSSAYAGQVSFVYAGTHTANGTYAIQVSHSATQATDIGTALSTGKVSAAETLSITEGSHTATLTTTSGESLATIAASLNAGFAANGMSLTASTVTTSSGATQLELTSSAYGSAASFSVSSNNTASGTTGLGGATANTAASFTGTDVAGTINGVAATGNGQVLAAPTSDPTLEGLSVLVTTPGISSTTSLGSLTYSPGVAQQLASLGDSATNAVNGSLTTAIQSLQNEATGLNGQIANYQQLESSQQTLLRNQFATMESTLGNLKNESSSISSSLANLPGW